MTYIYLTMLPLPASIKFSQFFTWFFLLHFIFYSNLPRGFGSLVVEKLIILFYFIVH